MTFKQNRKLCRLVLLSTTIFLFACDSSTTQTNEVAKVETQNEEIKPQSRDSFQKTESYLELSILSVSTSDNKSEALKIEIAVQSQGNTPLALSADQFSVHIFNKNNPYLFVGDVEFKEDFPRVFTIAPNKKVKFNFEAFADRFDQTKHWSKLPPGKYTLRIYVNSGKTANFDYQWLGQAYSNDYVLKIK